MECKWDSALLQQFSELPIELQYTIQRGNDQEYLDTLTKLTHDPRFTYIILAHCEDVLAHICASLRRHGSFASTVATLGRIVPYAPFLSHYSLLYLESENHTSSSEERNDDDDDDDLLYLLGLFRLLQFDRQRYCKFIQPTNLVLKLEQSPASVVYLVIRILQIYLDGADAWFETMVHRYLGADLPDCSISGVWDEKIIDYRFLTLWEQDRREHVLKAIQSAQIYLENSLVTMSKFRVLHQDVFDETTVLLGGTLLPRESISEGHHRLITTATVGRNLCLIAQGLKTSLPLLLTGSAGAGKTILIRHMAHQLGKLENMVTLHLNEQSDAKLLLGIYTTGDQPGSFIWKPGVLTTAVQEGRWVLIEDLDRAPTEVLGVLLPLIEREELFIPSRKERVVATQGFRLFATARTSTNYRNEEVSPLTHMLGQRHWQSVRLSVPSVHELGVIVHGLHPSLEPFLQQLMAVYERLLATQSLLAMQSKTGAARLANARDFMKWCQRISSHLDQKSSFTSSDIDNIYLEAVDCFVVALPSGHVRDSLSANIAEELRIDPQRRDYLLTNRKVNYESDKSTLVVGRYSLPRIQAHKKSDGLFSTNSLTIRMLECVTGAILNREPLLLVGETGVGKTTAVQHMAGQLGKKLVAFNLSQQSEAGDLLGGFKPVSTRTLIIPMKDEFDNLFAESFSSTKNRQFLELLSKQMLKSNWKTVCKLWRQALSMVEQQQSNSPLRDSEGPNKKRKTESAKTIDLPRWKLFANQVDAIEQRLVSGDQGFVFTFIEGNIVKAVRNGDWVLLDEINLAAPDTLEAIADLLDRDLPSLLMTEAGNIERIVAHPDFRIFAAMNPATDVGKKDLPPGIRSRFTELYVESPDKDAKCLQSIVQAYLRQECLSDLSLSSDITKTYLAVLKLAEENKLVDGAGQKPHFSLRTLTRTLSYAKRIQIICNIRRAMYEGFQMSFMTFLDEESARLVEPVIEKHLFGKRTNIRAELRKALRNPSDGHEYVRGHPESKHWIRKGPLDVEDQPQYIITPFVRNNLENLVRATSTRQFPVLIQGPTSSGKTSMIEYLAKRSGHRFVRINNHEHTDLQEYLGTYVSGADGRLQFQEGVLVKALREGHWVVLDELNLAPTDVLEALNRLLDDNRELLIPETQEIVRPHADFMLFATQNPAGLYGGRKTLSRAFRNRFLELHFDDIPIHELQEILHRRTELPESRCKRIVNVYKELSVLRQENQLFEQKSFATLRDLFRWALRPNDTIERLAQNGYMLLCERVRKEEERLALKAIIEKVMSANGPRVAIDEDTLYSRNCPEVQGYNTHADDKNVVWTRAMRRLYVLVSRAIQNNEPVLLVGETGCGKTTVCQMIAEVFKKDLHTVNAHQNTETGDLIGSQRPVRNRSSIESELKLSILDSVLLKGLNMGDTSTNDMLHQYDRAFTAMTSEQRNAYLQSDERSAIQSLRTRFLALFEWVDGSLVQALRTGEFFLLDEISLADDSVLERLNSVLEPGRTILLAEKGSLDSSVTAAWGFQFFATMNPGGDYGKRELSPALRNRFTEIWVPALTDSTDILQIVEAKLSPDVQHYAQVMVQFAGWFKSRFDTSVNSAVSIRDTLAWVQFVNLFKHHDAEASVIHGAAMVYIDTLGANPAGLMTISMQNLENERLTCLETLGQLMQTNAKAVYDSPTAVTASDKLFAIGPFELIRAPEAQDDISFSFEPLASRSNAMRVLRALQLSKPIMLEGSPGVGKTALITAIAQAVGMPLTRINLSDQTDLLDLFGSDAPVDGEQTGTFAWRDAPFLRAMKNGEWVLLDEMNLASQSILEGLNACLDHRGEVFVPELGQTFSRHKDFRLFAAQNPHHQGGGRKGLPASFVNRFTVVFADSFKEDDLNLICKKRYPSANPQDIQNIVSFVTRLSAEVSEHQKFGSIGSPWEFNLRDVSRWLDLAVSDGSFLTAGSASDFIDMLFTRRFRTTADQSCVQDLITSVYPDGPKPCDLHVSLSTRSLQIGLAVLPRHNMRSTAAKFNTVRLSHPNHLRVIQSMMICIRQGWPIVLSGSSGSGKTTLIEQLATVTGASIQTLSMNAETDTMDMIGGYEQHDPRRRTVYEAAVLQDEVVSKVKTTLLTDSSPQSIDLLHLLRNTNYDAQDSTHTQLLNALRSSDISRNQDLTFLDESTQRIDKARFEWIDGPLIEAIRQGHWLVLDNANLCSPSVLDRLNSLLEPQGVLMLNEHTGPDGAPLILRPHPNFRVFLTIDPRLGELSRAMRNRAVELHVMPEEIGVHMPLVDPLATESSMARFSAVKLLYDDNSKPDSDIQRIAGVIRDHFSLRDEALVLRLCQQLDLSLYRDFVGNSLEVCKQLMIDFAPSPEKVLQLEGFYQHCLHHSQVPADCISVQVSDLLPAVSFMVTDGKDSFQTLYPLNNQPFIQQSRQVFHEAHSLAAFYDLSFYLNTLERKISSLTSNHSFMQRLEGFLHLMREYSLSEMPRAKTVMEMFTRTSQGITNWLQQTLHTDPRSLLEVCQTGCQDLPKAYTWSQSQNSLFGYITFCHSILESLSVKKPDPALYNAYLTRGKLMCKRGKSAVEGSLFEQLGSILTKVHTMGNRSTGIAYMSLWNLLRPITPPSYQQLQKIVDFEALIEKFDALALGEDLPLQATTDLRMSFHQALSIINKSESNIDALVDKILTLLKISDSTKESHTVVRPHFAVSFELLCQHMTKLSLVGSTFSTSEVVSLEVLAGRTTPDSISFAQESTAQPSQRAFKLLGLTGSRTRYPSGFLKPEHARSGRSLGTTILQDISDTSAVNLRNFKLLEDEFASLCYNMAAHTHLLLADSMPALDTCLRRLLKATLSALLDDKAFASLRAGLSYILDHVDNESSLFSVGEFLNLTHTTQIDSLGRTMTRFLDVAQYLCLSSSPSHNFDKASNAWMSYAIASLELFVPDFPSDPVTNGQVEESVYLSGKTEMESRLAAVQTFTAMWTGDDHTLRARSLQTQVDALGPQPTTVQICRPPTSEILNLLAEFKALLRVLKPIRQADTAELQSTMLGSIDWGNVQVVKDRLVKKFRTYADITMPVVGFIDCLAVARDLSFQATTERISEVGTFGLDAITPLCGSSMYHWLSDDVFINAFDFCVTPKRTLHWLIVLAARSSAIPVSAASQALQSTIDRGFQQFYATWKQELTIDQKAAAAKSSLYKYRGDPETEDEVDAEELEAIFPGYESSPVTKHVNGTVTSRSQEYASTIARLYHSIFAGKFLDCEVLLEILGHYSGLDSSDRPNRDQMQQASVLLIVIHKLKNSIGPQSGSKLSANVYKDSNIPESKRLIAVIKRTRSRFNSINVVWPEHAVPIDILRLCDQILEESHAEPVMKYLPLVEKLHATVNEWQKVASSEYSASPVLDDITNMIIAWRQLELSTWAGLFDHEDKVCTESAASWWYIAYETIIVASDLSCQATELGWEFVHHLVESLRGFITNCGLGEFEARLQMLRDFQADLSIRMSSSPGLAKVHSALSTLILYYSHFQQGVAQSLSQRRLELEKKVKDIIQLASWKDRNIETLKSSSKSSHKKLFRLVRKYRQLLSDPVAPLLQGDFPGAMIYEQARPTTEPWAPHLRTAAEIKAVTDLLGPSSRLQQSTELEHLLSGSQIVKFDVDRWSAVNNGSQKVDEFLENLEQESSELRKATPNLLTEKNKELVQHLKTRKRRLLADVLRDLRLMGFQTNLSEDVLDQQRNIHAVLARSPILGSHLDKLTATNSDYEFMRLLHIMPTMRDAAAKPSDDLTPAEVARCKVLIESMLHVSAEQRRILNYNLGLLASLKLSINQLRSFAMCQQPLPERPGEETSSSLQIRVTMSLSVVNAVLQCVQFQADLAKRDYSDATEHLKIELEKLVAVNEDVQKLKQLPKAISSGDQRDLADRYAHFGQRMENIISEAISTHPELEPTLSPILLWSGKTGDCNGRPGRIPVSSSTIDSWMHDISKTASVLPKLISSVTSTSTVSRNTKASKAWLLDQQKSLVESMGALDVPTIGQNLSSMLDSLSSALTADPSAITILSTVCNGLYPIFHIYEDAVERIMSTSCALNASSSTMACRLAVGFIQLARQGFCTPSEKGEKEEKQSGDVQSGTGLGDGEGADDISKDIGADEDLSELAQDKGKDDDKDQEMKAEKDAVDMADEDLEGEFEEGEGSENDDGDEQDGQSDADVDEEKGSVGEDDKGAVDEKMWDDGKAQKDQEKETQNAKGEKSDDIAAAEEKDQKGEGVDDGDDVDMNEAEEGDEDSDGQVDQGSNEKEQIDPYAQMEDNLELPEDMMMDGEKAADDDISDIDSDFGDDAQEDETTSIGGKDEEKGPDREEDGDVEGTEDNREATDPEETENQPNQADEDSRSDIAMLDRDDDTQQDTNDGLVSGEDGIGQEQDKTQSNAQPSALDDMQIAEDTENANTGDGTEGGSNRTQDNTNSGQADQTGEEQQTSNFKQLGDVLNQWYDQQREIQSAMEREENETAPPEENADKTNTQFEHLPENVDSDMQALGAASADQSKPLNDDQRISVNETEPEDLPMPDEQPSEEPADKDQDADTSMPNDEPIGEEVPPTNQSKAMIGTHTEMNTTTDADVPAESDSESTSSMDKQLFQTHISPSSPSDPPSLLTADQARQLWSEHESRTRNMSLILTEHLRLILHPTQATKLRGDFRTGKRLNIKKIIPYIASSYKRDKIWMRRSVPSKRSYQIMLAIDDSKSMTESESHSLAFDTLALVAKSMAMLEVGEVCIVGFGENVNIAHEFSMPFTSEAGGEVFRRFSFAQTKTDVKRLLEKSIETFREARRMKAGAGAGNSGELWQLEIVISDGVCEEHEAIRGLVRQAYEERIMVVFIVIDSLGKKTGGEGGGGGVVERSQSILDLKTAKFTKDGNGEPQLQVVKYLDTFPFSYYLIVRDVQELPSVLAGALRQWFAEVVETGG